MGQSNSKPAVVGKPTDAPRPWDFPPGTLESRAAARAMIGAGERLVVRIIHIGAPEGTPLPEPEIVHGPDCTVEIRHAFLSPSGQAVAQSAPRRV